jgi:hypothetical protein
LLSCLFFPPAAPSGDLPNVFIEDRPIHEYLGCSALSGAPSLPLPSIFAARFFQRRVLPDFIIHSCCQSFL